MVAVGTECTHTMSTVNAARAPPAATMPCIMVQWALKCKLAAGMTVRRTVVVRWDCGCRVEPLVPRVRRARTCHSEPLVSMLATRDIVPITAVVYGRP